MFLLKSLSGANYPAGIIEESCFDLTVRELDLYVEVFWRLNHLICPGSHFEVQSLVNPVGAF